MRLGKLTGLMVKNVMRSWRTLTFSSIGVVVGVAILVFFVGLGYGLSELVQTKIFPRLPPNEIEVVPEVFATGRGDTVLLNQDDLQKIRAIPKVEAVFPRLRADFPAVAYISDPALADRFFQGRKPTIDLRIEGVDPKVLDNDREFTGKKEKFRFQGDELGKPIPVIVSNRWYALYLTSIAQEMQMRAFPKQALIGLRFNVRVGEGRFAHIPIKQGGPKERYGEIVGFSTYGNRAPGVSVPAEYIERYNREYQGDSVVTRYKSIVVKVASPEAKAEVVARLRELGFKPEVDAQEETVVKIVSTLTILFSIVSATIVLVAAIQIMHTFFMLLYERRMEIALLRALGATRGDVRWLIVSEAMFVGLLAGVVGVGLGLGGAGLADIAVKNLMPGFSQLDARSFFHFPPTVLLGAVGFAALFCMFGALLPARRAANMEPAEALSSH